MSEFFSKKDLFREQINLVKGDPQKFITAYLLEGDCSVFPDGALYTEFRHRAATALSPDRQNYSLAPEDIKVVGSGKLGYSLNPNKPFREFRVEEGSDLDVAVFSEQLFQQGLEDLHGLRFYDRLNRGLIGQKLSEEHYSDIYILRSVLDGFIPLESILTKMKFGQQWSKARDELVSVLGEGFEGIDINFRLYRSPRHLRTYQLRAVKKAITLLDSED